MRKTLFYSLILLSQTTIALAQGNTLFSIKPSETSLYLSSNGTASIEYVVTNNSTEKVVPSITLGYKSLGKHLSVGVNTCNVELSPQATCTFRALISGQNQPNKFTITPRVCGFNGFMCSTSTTAVTVNVTQVLLPTRAFEEISNDNLSYKTLIGININDPSDIINSFLDSEENINSVVSSPDGTKLYAIYSNNSIAFFDVDVNSLILIYNLTLFFSVPGLHTSALPVYQMAITPDGKSLFVVGSSAPSVRTMLNAPLTLFRIDLTTDPATVHVIEDPDNLLEREAGLVVSPDGKTLYISSYPNVVVAMPVNANSISNANLAFPGAMPDDTHLGIAIDSAGNRLFVANQSEGTVSIFTITDGVTRFDKTILIPFLYSGANGLAVSPDGETLYVAETGTDQVLAVSLSNPDSVFTWNAISQPFGLALSPNGALLYVSQAQDHVDRTTVIDTLNYLASPTYVSILGKSYTIGQFMGP